MKNLLIIVSLIFLAACNQQSEQKQSDLGPMVSADSIRSLEKYAADTTSLQPENMIYQYDTLLKDGYYISYKNTDSLQYLYLKKGDSTIKEISSIESGLLQKNLGYVTADYGDQFLLMQSYGSGNPHYFLLINKADGQTLLEGTYLGTDADRKILLYTTKPLSDDKNFALYKVAEGTSVNYEYPSDMACTPGVEDCATLVRAENHSITIEYNNTMGVTKKSYNW